MVQYMQAPYAFKLNWSGSVQVPYALKLNWSGSVQAPYTFKYVPIMNSSKALARTKITIADANTKKIVPGNTLGGTYGSKVVHMT